MNQKDYEWLSQKLTQIKCFLAEVELAVREVKKGLMSLVDKIDQEEDEKFNYEKAESSNDEPYLWEGGRDEPWF